MPPHPSFQELIQPLGKAEFFTEVEGRCARHFPGPRNRFEGLFGWNDVQRLLDMASLWSDQALKLVLDGAEVPLEEFCLPGRTREGQPVMLPVAARLEAFLGRGATLVLDRIEDLSPPLAALSRHLESVLGASVVCNVYCSWQAHQGFPSHNDTTDVYVLHIEGLKRWNIYNGRALNPSTHPGHHYSHLDPEHHARARGPLQQQLELEAGDMLYLPRGQYHDAIAGSAASLHLSFGINRALGMDVMQVLMESLADDAHFRQELPHFDSAGPLQAHLRVLADRLREQLADADLAAQVAAWQRQRVLRNMPVTMRLPQRQGRDWLRVRQTGQRLARRNDGTWLVDGEGRELQLNGDETSLAEWILDRELFAIEDYLGHCDQAPEAARELLDRLCQEGCLEAV